jgi:hypothetical protein
VRDSDEPAAPPVVREHVEDRRAAHPQPRREVGAHAVLGRCCAGEHRREADDRARGIGRLDREVLGALACKPVHHGGSRLPEPPPVAAVDDDDVHAPRERIGAALLPPGRIAREPLREASRGKGTEPGADRQGGRNAGDGRRSRLLRDQRGGAQHDQQLRNLLQGVAARRVGVGEHQAPEAQPVRPRRARAEVVVDGAPHHDREERVAGERAGQQQGRAPGLEQWHRGERGQPE